MSRSQAAPAAEVQEGREAIALHKQGSSAASSESKKACWPECSIATYRPRGLLMTALYHEQSMSFATRPQTLWQLPGRTLGLGQTTVVVGIVNVTPDSFSESGATATHEAAIAHALRLLDQGAAILDIGGESSRPGSHAATAQALSAGEEQDRVLPVIEAILRDRPAALLSIDTYRASTARAAISAGCAIVNDVSGLLWDLEMAATCAELGCGVVLMHTRGRPDQWRTLPPLAPDQVLSLVARELQQRLDAALDAGIRPQAIVLDPGYGFGKAFGANYPLLARQHELLSLGRPILAGISRKSFLGRTLASLHGGHDAPLDQREPATLAATVAAVLAGASLVRVHQVRPAVEAVAIADAILSAQRSTSENAT
jgi:dihydropteroate synthase